MVKISGTLFYFLSLSCIASAQKSSDIIGKWQDARHADKIISVYKNYDGTYEGKAINNGSIVFKRLLWDSQTHTYKGTLIHPESKAEYPIDIQITNATTLAFTIQKFFISKKFTFIIIK
jgi:hypothetical protein